MSMLHTHSLSGTYRAVSDWYVSKHKHNITEKEQEVGYCGTGVSTVVCASSTCI